MEFAQLQSRLAEFGQEHLLRFWPSLSSAKRIAFAAELEAVDWPLLRQLCQAAEVASPGHALALRAEPPEAVRLRERTEGRGSLNPRAAREAGESALRRGEVGVVLVAGGEGSRLGFPHPKGMFPIGPVSGDSLLQILLEKVLATSRRYSAALPLYVMTSPATHESTCDFLESQERFGLPAEDVRIICQGTMPSVEAGTGRGLLQAPGKLAQSPDGHGGLLAALANSGSLEAMQQRGLTQLFYMQVDNPLVQVAEPEFLGFHLLHRAEVTTQVVAKRTPLDKVGNLVQVDGRAQIIEYSDLPESIATLRNGDGSLRFWAGNVAVHVFGVAFLRRCIATSALAFHRAVKVVPYLDGEGTLQRPEQPNAWKFEKFIFDLLPAADRSLAVEVDSHESFSPLKNAVGSPQDAPEHVQAALIARHRQWLRAAGVTVAEGVAVEISPLFALDAAELAAKVSAGERIERARLFRPPP